MSNLYKMPEKEYRKKNYSKYAHVLFEQNERTYLKNLAKFC